MRLLLIRHGQTINNLGGLGQGWTDTDLDDTGRNQAEALAKVLAEQPLDAIFSSDLRRAVDTARPLSQRTGIPIQTTQLLRERFLGELENEPISELRAAFEREIEATGEGRCHVRPRGVESAYDVMARVIAFTRMLPNHFDTCAIFTHGMTEEVLLCHLIGAPVESSRSFNFPNASITSLAWYEDIWVLERYGDTRHLEH